MANNTSVSYKELNSRISRIKKISEYGYSTYKSIQTLKSVFSISNSDVSNELKKSLEEYENAHYLIMELCTKSVSMLEKAKYVYENSDNTTDDYVDGGDD